MRSTLFIIAIGTLLLMPPAVADETVTTPDGSTHVTVLTTTPGVTAVSYRPDTGFHHARVSCSAPSTSVPPGTGCFAFSGGVTLLTGDVIIHTGVAVCVTPRTLGSTDVGCVGATGARTPYGNVGVLCAGGDFAGSSHVIASCTVGKRDPATGRLDAVGGSLTASPAGLGSGAEACATVTAATAGLAETHRCVILA